MRISEEEREHLRRAHHLDGKSIRQLARETGYSRDAIGRMVGEKPSLPEPKKHPRSSPVFGPYRSRVEELLKENERLPRKQRYTSHKIYERLQLEGYEGCESRIRQYIGEWNREHHRLDVFLPLEFDPGQDAQCDWGQAVAIIAGQRQVIQVFVIVKAGEPASRLELAAQLKRTRKNKMNGTPASKRRPNCAERRCLSTDARNAD